MKVAVLLSGGVDSSVALALLREQGHTVHAFYLKIWLEDDASFMGNCPWHDDLESVQAVCAMLQVPLQIICLQKEYYATVVAYTLAQIRAGLTPNPDIMCNAHIKFGLFFDHIDPSFQYVATGHYAQILHTEHGSRLYTSPDTIKDQTYFLAYLRQHQLNRALFPIGHLCKMQVRALAHYYNLPTKDRKDSQGICFLGKLKFRDFLHHYLGDHYGDIIEWETGIVLGQHKGFWYFTHGQRQGIGLAGGPWYVVTKEVATNKVFVSRHYYAVDKQRVNISVVRCHWIADECQLPITHVKLRHGPQRHGCSVYYNDGSAVKVRLEESDQGIAPGQFTVFYQGQQCLGAGVIDGT